MSKDPEQTPPAPAASSIPEKPSPSPAPAVCFRCDGCGQINMDEDEGPIDCPVCVAPPMPSWPGAPESGKPPTCGAEPRIESTAKCGQPLPCPAHPQEDAAARVLAAEQSASALRQERDALRAELAEWGDWKNGAVIGDDPASGSLEQLREWVKAEKTKCAAEGSVFDTGFRCVSEGGILFEFDPESVAALFDRAEKAEADASALRALFGRGKGDASIPEKPTPPAPKEETR